MIPVKKPTSGRKTAPPPRSVRTPEFRSGHVASSVFTQSTAKSANRQNYPFFGVNTGPSSGFRTSELGRPSFARSSFAPGGRDPRLDREALERKVWNFLSETEFRVSGDLLVRDLAPERLQRLRTAPSRAEFAEMFGHLIRSIDGNNYRTTKIEEEMPKMMAALGYPVQLKYATMQTIGAPHVMPQLYHALAWLVDAGEIFRNTSTQDLLLACEEGDGNCRSLAYGFAVSCFKKTNGAAYTDFDPNHFPEDSDKLRVLMAQADDLPGVEADLREREAVATEKLLELSSVPNQVETLKNDIAEMKGDIAERREYMKKLELNQAQLEKAKAAKMAAQAERAEKIAAMKAEIAAKEQQIASQKMSGDEVRDLRMRITETNAIADSLKKELAEAERDCDEAYKANFSSGSKLRDMYEMLVKDVEGFVRKFKIAVDDLGEYADVFDMMPHVSPNEAAFTDYLQKFQVMAKKLQSIVREKVALFETGKLCAEKKKMDLVVLLDREMQLYEEFRRQQSDTRHHEALAREDWQNEEGKLRMDLDVMINQLEHIRSSNKESVTIEELAEAKKKAQNDQREFVGQQITAVQFAVKKILDMVNEYDCVKESIALLDREEARLRGAVEAFVRDEEANNLNLDTSELR